MYEKSITMNLKPNTYFPSALFLAMLFGILPVSSLVAQEVNDKPQDKESTVMVKTDGSSEEKEIGPLDVTLKSISGQDVQLSKYKGKVVVVVNTASKCGFTRQYKQLEEIYQAHQKTGLAVLGFPCNQFGAQEPGSEKEISDFCKSRYGVSFDMFAKSDVNGKERNALYQVLCKVDLKPKGKGDVKWNFEKFVIGRDGKPVGRYSSRVSPTDEDFVSMLKQELAKEVPVGGDKETTE